MFKKYGVQKRKFKRLISFCKERKLAIIVRDDPSLDALAAAASFKDIVDHFGVESDIFYRGSIKDATILNLMEGDLRIISTPSELMDYEVVLIGALPKDIKYISEIPMMAICSYKGDTRDIVASYVDLRPDTTTNSSIIIDYHRVLGIEISENDATRMAFAIRDATDNFMHDITRFDIEAYMYINPLVNIDLLAELEHPSVKPETFTNLVAAINNKSIKDTHMVTSIGYARDFSGLPRLCRYLLDWEGVLNVLIFAVGHDSIRAYAESKNIKLNMRKVIERAFGEWGKVRGTASYALIDMPLGIFKTVMSTNDSDILLSSVNEVISSRYFVTMEGEGF